MKFLQVNVAMVIITLCSLVGPTQEKVLNDNNDLRQTIKSMQMAMAKLQERVDYLEADNSELRKMFNDDKQMTADSLFLAIISEFTVPIAPGEPIIWDSAPINPGGHFNTILGMYEAPVNGYYQFSATKLGDSFSGTFFFLVDEVRYALMEEYTAADSDGTPSASTTINIELMAGQLVRIENIGSSNIYGTAADGFVYSWFTGHLLYAL